MKNIIKILIALTFILGSYFLGFFKADEKYSNQLKAINEKLLVEQSRIEILRDSISTLKKVINSSTSQSNDTSRTKLKSSVAKELKRML